MPSLVGSEMCIRDRRFAYYLIPFLFRRLRPLSISKDTRIAIVFSLFFAVVYQSWSYHICLFSSSPPLAHPPCAFHILPLCQFYSLLLCDKGTSMHLSPPPHYWYTSFFFLTGLGPLHEIVVSAFWRSPSDRANTFSILSVLVTPRIFTSALYPPNFSVDSSISS